MLTSSQFTSRFALSLIVLGPLLSPPASAQFTGDTATVMTRVSGPYIAQLLRSEGYQANISADSDGDPRVITSTQGVNVYVNFYDCDSSQERQCGMLQFRVGFNTRERKTHEEMNDWNRSYRLASAYVDDDGDPWLKMDMVVTGGITAKNFSENFSLWESLLSNFLDTINWR